MKTSFKLSLLRTAAHAFQDAGSVLQPLLHLAAVVTFVGGLAFTGAAQAAGTDTPDPSQGGMIQNASSTASQQQADPIAQRMAQHVEDRIKTLHRKLAITDAQEAKWNDVTAAMRDNEATLSALIEARHENPQSMTAIDDLQSYENITQAHVDGLKKLIPAFQSLYTDMSDDQKKNADKIFGTFEGHHGHHSPKHSS